VPAAATGAAVTSRQGQGQGLRALDLDELDLGWLSWDRHTRWPDGWAERMETASAEQPPGSGQFTVLPAFDSDTADAPADIT
jgi:hypothetical protein